MKAQTRCAGVPSVAQDFLRPPAYLSAHRRMRFLVAHLQSAICLALKNIQIKKPAELARARLFTTFSSK